MTGRIAIVICGSMIACIASEAFAETTLHFRAIERGKNDVGVVSHLYRKEPGGAEVKISPGGVPAEEFVYVESDCKNTTQYTMRPRKDTEYTYSTGFWLGCEKDKEYLFAFTPRRIATNLTTLVYNGAMALGQTSVPDPVLQSLKEGDYGTAAYLSTELSVALDGAGKPVEASQWRNAAVVAGWQAVATQVEADLPAQPLSVINGGVVLTEPALDVVKVYQKSIGVEANGKLNWPTLKSLSNIAGTNIEELRVQKLETLGPLAAE